MKIAMIGHKQIGTREGGVEKTVLDLSCAFLKNGDEVTVYDRKIKENVKKRNIHLPKGIRVIRIPTFPGAAEVPIYSFLAAIHAAFRHYDLVMFHASGSCVMLPIVKMFGKKTVAFIHGIDSKRSKWGKFASRYLYLGERRAAKWADRVLVLSVPMQKYFYRLFGRKTTLVRNGIRTSEHFKKNGPQEEKRILSSFGLERDGYFFWTGRISKEKGLQYLIPAFLHCKTEKKLVLAGRISSQKNNYYRELLKTGCNSEQIFFINSQSEQVLNALYRNAYAFVFPSELEGMAHSLLEAQAAGAACILSDIPENKDVAKKHALYFKSCSEEDLERIMKDLLAHPEQRKSITDGQVEAILRDYNLELSTGQIIQICRDTVGI